MNEKITMKQFTVDKEKADRMEVGDTVSLCLHPSDVAEGTEDPKETFRTFTITEIKMRKHESGAILAEIKVADKEEYEKWCKQ